MANVPNAAADYGDVIVQASAGLRERFGLTVGDVEPDELGWGVSVILVGKGCNFKLYAESQRECDFMIILVPAGLNTYKAICDYNVSYPGPRQYVYMQEVIQHESKDPKRDIKRFNKLCSFWSWRDFFFGDVSAWWHLQQFTELCNVCGDIAGSYLLGEKSIASVPRLS